MKNYTFKYGDGTVTASLDEKSVLAELHGHPVAPIADIGQELYHQLDHPMDALPLRTLLLKGMKIAVIVSDLSRFWMRQDLVVPHLIRYLLSECGIPAEDITIVIANGTHPGGDEKELRTLVTDDVFDTIKVENHDCHAKDLVFMGTTPHDTPVYLNRTVAQADFVVALGAATHHVMAGYGGGRKSILPGVSGIETINHNHAYSLDPHSFVSNPLIGNGVLENNPLNDDMCEAAALVPHLFMVNLVMNAEMKLAYITAGHYLTSWREACRLANEIYKTPIRQKADVVIASCGGFPKDMSLYQGTKSIDNVESALKPGGTLILLIEARDGGGPEEYFSWAQNLQDGTMEHRLRTDFTIPGYIFFLNCEQAARYRIMLLTSIRKEDVAPMGIEAYTDINELLQAANLDGKSIYVIENGSTVIPCVEE